MRSKGSAVNLVRAFRLAISRLHKHLAAATDAKGQPDPVLRPFADHLATDLIAAAWAPGSAPAALVASTAYRQRACYGQAEYSINPTFFCRNMPCFKSSCRDSVS